MRWAKQLCEDPPTDHNFLKPREAARVRLQNQIRNRIESRVLTGRQSITLDLLNDALSHVDFREIADRFLRDVQER
jgi:hypothetical protein